MRWYSVVIGQLLLKLRWPQLCRREALVQVLWDAHQGWGSGYFARSGFEKEPQRYTITYRVKLCSSELPNTAL